MQMRRLTRLTNAFSKNSENLWAALCLHFAYYNFCRVHQTIRVTPRDGVRLDRTRLDDRRNPCGMSETLMYTDGR